jgi:hypothetical protein
MKSSMTPLAGDIHKLQGISLLLRPLEILGFM